MSSNPSSVPLCSVGGDGRTGLVNKLHDCYLNTFLQCVGHTDPFRQHILSIRSLDQMDFGGLGSREGEDRTSAQVAYAFHHLIVQLWSNKYTCIYPQPLKTAFMAFEQDLRHATHPITQQNFSGDQQHDITELIAAMFLELDRFYNRRRELYFEVQPGSSMIEASLHHHALTTNSIIQDLFTFHQSERIVCLNCQTPRMRTASATSIMVEIPELSQMTRLYSKLNLYTCLDQFFIEEDLEDVSHCPTCKKTWVSQQGKTKDELAEMKKGMGKQKYKEQYRQKGRKKLGLLTLPPILIISLKRFNLTGFDHNNQAQFSKNGSFVDFPVKGLDMRKYWSPIGQQSADTSVYDLYAVANQTGGLVGGHYFAYAKPSHDFRNIGWRHLEDRSVQDMAESSVVTDAAYVLFYRRRQSGDTIARTVSPHEQVDSGPPPTSPPRRRSPSPGRRSPSPARSATKSEYKSDSELD